MKELESALNNFFRILILLKSPIGNDVTHISSG